MLHSNLSDGERFDAWQRLRSGQTRVAVGVRSAVFAPVQNLQLIIMDEEHETTYKQSEPEPRYHTREVARRRMELNHGCCCWAALPLRCRVITKLWKGKAPC